MELLRVLAALAERPAPEHAALATLVGLPCAPAEDTWTDVFLLGWFPYASVHLGPEGMLGGEARDRVAGFLRSLDATPPPEPDHLPVLLVAHADLCERAGSASAEAPTGDAAQAPAAGAAARAAHGARALLHEHLLSWLPLYLGRLRVAAPEPYAAWATLLDDVLRAEAVRRHEPATLPSHLREAPGLDDPRVEDADAPLGDLGGAPADPSEPSDTSDTSDPAAAGGRRERRRAAGPGRTLLEQLLVPVRTGMVLSIHDLARCGRELGVPVRIGERRYVLEHLLGQDTAGTLRWLAEHATTTTDAALQDWAVPLPRATAWWRARARATAELLEGLAVEADGAEVVPLA